MSSLPFGSLSLLYIYVTLFPPSLSSLRISFPLWQCIGLCDFPPITPENYHSLTPSIEKPSLLLCYPLVKLSYLFPHFLSPSPFCLFLLSTKLPHTSDSLSLSFSLSFHPSLPFFLLSPLIVPLMIEHPLPPSIYNSIEFSNFPPLLSITKSFVRHIL